MPTTAKAIFMNLAVLAVGLFIINTFVKVIPVAGPLAGKFVNGLSLPKP